VKPVSHSILISLGSNIDKEENTRKGLDAMAHCFGEIELSTVYESKAIGFSGNNFFNLVVKAHTDQSISQVCSLLKGIEEDCGRLRQSEKFSPRTLDLDLLTYNDTVCTKPITLPREEIVYNAFVLQPMAELVPNEIHPVTKQTYAQMWQQYDKTKQQLWPVSFTWSAP
jgi:2-amino-4-hydroxy-6-hydroxymethyldihydropteridine diphosphokinase